MLLFKTAEEYTTYARNFIFGVEDSLVSTVGLLSGIAASGAGRSTIVLTGLVLIFVEGVSMGIGSYLSENSVASYPSKNTSSNRTSITGGIIMLLSYLGAGLVPLFPYLFIPGTMAFGWSIFGSLAALSVLGILSGKFLSGQPWRNGIRFLTLGGLAIGVGVLVGKFVQNWIS